MNKRKIWKKVLYVLTLMLVVCLLFAWYSGANRRRIREQNLNYALDTIRQSSVHVKNELESALYQIRSDAYFVDAALEKPEISPELLHTMEQNSAFDAIRFTNDKGITVDSDGNTIDSSDRDYYIKGMKGKSGISYLMDSRFSGDTMINFYTPLHFEGKIIGVLRGVYSAEDYLQKMLADSYFGKMIDVFLCDSKGNVIASSNNNIYGQPLLTMLVEDGTIDAATGESANNLFRQEKAEAGFLCGDTCSADILCVSDIQGSDYVLVQTFPRSVTHFMTRETNRIGIIFQVVLIAIFSLGVWFIQVQENYKSRRLKQENQDMGYITAGMHTMFNHFILVDLEQDTYRYLYDSKPKRVDLPAVGKYEELVPYISSFLADKGDEQSVLKHLDKAAIVKNFGNSGSILQYEYLVFYDTAEWMQCNIICLERKDGNATKVMFLWQNVTGLKLKEKDTQHKIALANRRVQRYVAATLKDAICVYEVNLSREWVETASISEYNQLVVSELGQKVAAELEQISENTPCSSNVWLEKWKQFVEPESLDDYLAWSNVHFMKECFSKGKTETVVEYWVRSSDGHRLRIRESCFLSTDKENGDTIGLVVARDITRQVQKQQEQLDELQDALKQAKHANNAKSVFLSNMSHDIRTPMNAVMGYTNMALASIDNGGQVRAYLEKVISSGNHLLNLLNEILNMSHLESAQMQLREQECSLPEIVHDMFNILQPQIQAKNMEISANVFRVVNEAVVADPLKLCQILINLMGNAIKYTPAGGKITFCIIQKPSFNQAYGDYIFIVQDNGVGMSPEFIEHIFEPFERESTVTKSGIKGLGIGMTITKHIVDRMGGKITVASQKDEGSVFRVELQLKLQDVPEAEGKEEELKGLRVLLVDDDLDSCDSICRMLRRIGTEAEWVSSGKEAVRRVQSSYYEEDPYSVYMIHWRMLQEMSGMETTEKIREAAGEEAPIIILAADDWTNIEQDARSAGASAFLAKPVFYSTLKSVLLSDIRPVHISAKEKDIPEKPQIDFTGKRVLLVDDMEINREVADAVLSGAGFVVETAPDGTDAVRMVQNSDEYYYDAIVTDIQMPIMDGYETAREVRAMQRKDVQNMPIIALSANSMDEDKANALVSGINDWILKPIDAEIFMEVLAKYL